MEKKYIIKKDILYYIIIFFFLLYFTIHSFYGDRGFVSYCLVQKKIESKLETLTKLQSIRIKLKNQVNLVRNESIDLDILNEQARKKLNFANPKELIFTVNPNK